VGIMTVTAGSLKFMLLPRIVSVLASPIMNRIMQHLS